MGFKEFTLEGAVRIVDPEACYIDYRLNLLGVRVREKDCQLRNQAKAIAACDFFVVVRAGFRTLRDQHDRLACEPEIHFAGLP